MESLASGRAVKELIQQYEFRFNKNLGQNFLIDSNILNKIIGAAEISKSTGIIEIGPGIGVMTQALAEKAAEVVAIELDSNLIPILNNTLKGYTNIKIINEDALKVDIDSIIRQNLQNLQVKVVANLPYYITTPIIMSLLEKRVNVSSIVVMVQKEVAQRMAAGPGEKDYGALSVAVQYFTKPRIVTTVSPHCFMPQPKVDSMVVKLDVRKHPFVEVQDERKFFNVVKAAFGQRRKTLVNALFNSGLFKMSKEEIKQLLKDQGIEECQRGETLSIMQFARLSNAIF